jgi:hypothetical protein
LDRQQARLLACDHYHVIFTLPHELNALWLANVPLLSALLFQAARDTLGTLLADPKYLGAQPGIIAAWPTWRQTLVLHPHLHCLITGGGVTPAGRWVAVRHGFLLPARVVMAVFRGKMLAAIRQSFACGKMKLPASMRPQQLLNLLHRLGPPAKTKWKVWIMERYRHGAGVVTYLARYLRGGPIQNARLVAWDGHRVTFLYRARQAEAAGSSSSAQRMTLSVADFLQRWLQHVPVPQTRMVRSYGLYQPTRGAALASCRTHLGQPPVVILAPLDWQTGCAQRGDAHPERCPTCGQRLVCTGVIPRGGAPPCVRPAERVACGRSRRSSLRGVGCAQRPPGGGRYRAGGTITGRLEYEGQARQRCQLRPLPA